MDMMKSERAAKSARAALGPRRARAAHPASVLGASSADFPTAIAAYASTSCITGRHRQQAYLALGRKEGHPFLSLPFTLVASNKSSKTLCLNLEGLLYYFYFMVLLLISKVLQNKFYVGKLSHIL